MLYVDDMIKWIKSIGNEKEIMPLSLNSHILLDIKETRLWIFCVLVVSILINSQANANPKRNSIYTEQQQQQQQKASAEYII